MKINTLLLSPFLFFSLLHAQPVTHLVFEGAGIKGLAYAGVVAALEEADRMREVRHVAGTSAGAITALLVALDYKSGEVLQIVSDTRFESFNDGGFPLLGGAVRMGRSYGWYKGERFLRWLEDLIEAKTGNPDITFEQMHQAGFRDLYVTATCINRQQMVVLSRHTYPNMRLLDAVRISMSIPFYFQAMWIDEGGRVLGKREERSQADLMVDGGFLANFPIFLFDSLVVNECGTQVREPHPGVVGARMDSDAQIAQDRSGGGLATQQIGSFQQYVAASFVLVAESLNRPFATPGDWERTISISSLDIGAKIRRMSEAEKTGLYRSGFEATETFLKKRN